MVNKLVGFCSTDFLNKTDIQLDMNETFDIFAQESLKEIYAEKESAGEQLFVACIVDKAGKTFVGQASEIAKWHLNLQHQTVPTTRQEFSDLAIYRYDKESQKFKFFCNRVDFATKPFFTCEVALSDINLSKQQLAKVYKILANCYHFGEGGAPKEISLANHFAEKHLQILKSIAKKNFTKDEKDNNDQKEKKEEYKKQS